MDVQAVGRAVKDQLSRQQPRRGPVHESVPAITGDNGESDRVGQPVDHRMRVGRHLIQTRPLAQQSGLPQQRKPPGRQLQMLLGPGAIDRLVETGNLVRIGLAGQYALALAVKIE